MKSQLNNIKPSKKPRLMDLVELAGIDVSDWANFKRGKNWAAANPRYCYKWSFVDIKKQIVIVTLWYSNIESGFICHFNHKKASKIRIDANQRERAKEMDLALQMATKDNLPVRVIINDGKRSEDFGGVSVKAKVTKRMLDPEPWHIEEYNAANGECVLKRGKPTPIIIDQFEIQDFYITLPKKIKKENEVYQRNASVRRNILKRADGYCEWCGEKGFITDSGAIYLESHHIVPLSEGGLDAESNVIALCPNHHKKAHYAKGAFQKREELLQKINKSKLNK